MPTPYASGAGSFTPSRGGLRLEEPVGDLAQEPRPVARLLVAAHGAAVHQVLEHGDAIGNDAVRAVAVHVDEEADAARVVLERWIVESCPARRPAGRRGVIVFVHASLFRAAVRQSPSRPGWKCIHILHIYTIGPEAQCEPSGEAAA